MPRGLKDLIWAKSKGKNAPKYERSATVEAIVVETASTQRIILTCFLFLRFAEVVKKITTRIMSEKKLGQTLPCLPKKEIYESIELSEETKKTITKAIIGTSRGVLVNTVLFSRTILKDQSSREVMVSAKIIVNLLNSKNSEVVGEKNRIADMTISEVSKNSALFEKLTKLSLILPSI